MLYKVKELLVATPSPAKIAVDEIIIKPEDDRAFSITRVGGSWRVSGRQIERVVAMTYFEFDTTITRFQHILESMGITQALEEAGVQEGDIVLIGDQELEWGK